MPKIASKIAVPIILVGLFAIAVFIAMDYEQLNLGFYIVLLFFCVYIFFFGLAIGQNTSANKRNIRKSRGSKQGKLV